MNKNLNNNYYIGLISGTSMDAIDCVLVEINSSNNVNLIDVLSYDIPEDIYNNLYKLINNNPENNHNYNKFDLINLIYQTDTKLGEVFANAVLKLIHKAKINPEQIKAIGSHGQTIYHKPEKPNSFTVQIGNPNTIAAKTNITTIANFRNIDLAYGGQGAPLVPIFHQEVFMHKVKNRVIVNIGGLANITYLNPTENIVLGFDTGPGNTLLDLWFKKNNLNNLNNYDLNGDFAKSGNLIENLLNIFLDDPYFKIKPPKSTGREYFNLNWLEKKLKLFNDCTAQDIQRTLLELSVTSITNHITKYCPNTHEVYFCGGGVHNKFLMQKLSESLDKKFHGTTDKLNIPADWVEAMTFAYLAYKNINQQPLDLRKITGSTVNKCILGAVYYS
tara:strand:+ start:4151 stop:5314 length:1164 start_codon:yes stop_codon:yes gene_type:complete